METRLGVSLGDVRVQTNAESSLLARAVNARAFAVGRDLFFDQNEYQPHTMSGRQLLAHEITHVAQSGLRSSPGAEAVQGRVVLGATDDPCEREADATAERLLKVGQVHSSASQSLRPAVAGPEMLRRQLKPNAGGAGPSVTATPSSGSTPTAAAAPVATVSKDPKFYAKALKGNKKYAARPGWPFLSEWRSLWKDKRYDAFADAVSTYQVQTMGLSTDDADGILGAGVTAALSGTIAEEMGQAVPANGHANLRAFLRVIQYCETRTDSDDAYHILFGGGTFSDTTVHPNARFKIGGAITTAAGAYQITYSTWRAAVKAGVASDFSPAAQDGIAVWLIMMNGALPAVESGAIEKAVPRLLTTWTSLQGVSVKGLKARMQGYLPGPTP